MKTLKRIFNVIYVCSLVVLCASAAAGAAYFTGYLPEHVRVEEIEKLVHVETPKPTFKELMKTVPAAYGIPEILVDTIVEAESGGRMDAIRFEAHHWDRAVKIAPKNSPKDTIRLYASSVCSLQIMGWHAPRYGLTPADLFEPENCVEVGMAILRDCLSRHKDKSKYAQYRSALTCWNGSEDYADRALSQLGRKLIEREL